MNIFAHTKPGCDYPAFVSVNERDGKFVISVRSQGRYEQSHIEIPASILREMGDDIISYFNRGLDV